MIQRLTDHPAIERAQRTGEPGPERQPISGTVCFCVVFVIDQPPDINALLTAHAAVVLSDFAVDAIPVSYEASAIVEMHVDGDAECYDEEQLQRLARERLQAQFKLKKSNGELPDVREMDISHIEETNLD